MKTILLIILYTAFYSNVLFAQPDLKYLENQSLNWHEAIEFYQYLDQKYEEAKLIIAGETDSGKPLHLFIISGNRAFSPETAHENSLNVLLINNGIHPGEPCGVDASAKFALDMLENQEEYREVLNKTVICIIPILNVGGALNRSEFHRANQNGPKEQGFRGNSINMDLNRDFIKLDTRNGRSFVNILQEWDPDILIDTHTSNGSDYRYTLTVIATQRNKLNALLSELMYERMLPELKEEMKKSPYEIIPYVDSKDHRDPKNGIVAFMDYPRYTTGYASLFNIMGFTLETHMFKDFSDRVLSSYYFIKNTSFYLAENSDEIKMTRDIAKSQTRNKKTFVLDWELDTMKYEEITFKGYEIKYRTSKVTGLETYYFDRQSPWEMPIKNYSWYKAVKTIDTPDFYILPAAWKEVVELLKLNNVEMYPMQKDTLMPVEYYYIEDFDSYPGPYNGHYFHSNVKIRKEEGELNFLSGDLFIPLNQEANEFIVNVLEPEAKDSYFNWNFFDPILSRKEYFSPYVFDEKAVEILLNNPVLKAEFDTKRKDDEAFSKNQYDQLRFIYERSEYSEKTLNRYPVARFYLDK